MKRCLALLLTLLLISGCDLETSTSSVVSSAETVVESTVSVEEQSTIEEIDETETSDNVEITFEEDLSSDDVVEATADTIDASEDTEDATDESEDTVAATDEIEDTPLSTTTASFDLASIPDYSGDPYVVVNDNVPYFTAADLTTVSFETYSDLDSLGRCGVAYACIGQDIMPTESRGSIGSVKPTGWHTVKYDIVSGNYLYNRCHLIAYELAAENANEKNLITGTRYMNVDGMLPFENMVADYVKETDNHVMYRVTPIFEGDNLLASGVLMEAMSVEDNGEDILFCIYCYNVQPGVGIDYATGDSWLEDDTDTDTDTSTDAEVSGTTTTEENTTTSEERTYILNTNTKKFHLPSCSSVAQMSEQNKSEYTGTREDVIAKGYEACKRCNP